MVVTASVDNDSLPDLHVCQHVVVPLTEGVRVPGMDRDEKVGGRGFYDPADVPGGSVAGDMNLVVLAAAEQRQPVEQLVLVDRHLWAERAAARQDEGHRAGTGSVSDLGQEVGRPRYADHDLVAALPDCLSALGETQHQTAFIAPIVGKCVLPLSAPAD